MSDSAETPAPSIKFTRNKTNPERLGKHLRRRYWSSWEEMKLVEIWRRYSDEVTTTVKHTPVFSSISCDMKSFGFHVNSQEVRRKINQLKNKYITERRLIENSDPDNLMESEWTLYPLLHCLINPINKHKDVCHERNIVKQLLEKMPPISPAQRRQRRPLSFDTKDEPDNKHTNDLFKPSLALAVSNPYKRNYNALVPSSSYRSTPPVRHTRASKGCIDFRLSSFKIPRLENLRQDNLRLAEHRDLALRNLYLQEREVKMLEQLVQGLQCFGK